MEILRSERAGEMFISEMPCKLHVGSVDCAGYGRVCRHGQRRAHRAAWIEANGPIPNGLYVLHHCDVRNCIEPTHLYLGTQADNMRDMVLRGRANRPMGGKNGRALLGIADVQDIRASEEKAAALSKVYNVSRQCIYAIKTGRTWKYL